MKNFATLKKIISLALGIAIASSTAHAYPFRVHNRVAAKTIAEIQAERKANNDKIAEYEEQLKKLAGDKNSQQAYQKTLKDQIALFKANIDSLNQEIDAIGAEIDAAEKRIQEIDDSIVQMQKDIDDGVENFKKRLYSIYVSNDASLAGVLLGSNSFYDMVANTEMLNRIADYDKKLITGILENIDNIEASRKELEIEKRTLEMKKSTQEKRKAEKTDELEKYSEKARQTQEEIDRLAREEEALNNKIDELNAANAEKDKEIDAINAEIERKRQEWLAAQQPQTPTGNGNGGGGNQQVYYPPTGGNFMWPTPGFYLVTSGFGYRWGRLHGGIDIGDGGIHGGAVVASKGGTVIAVNNSCTHDYYKTSSCGCGGGYGNYVTIFHDGTFSTQYAHLLSASVSVGQTVTQGQVIGYVGCTGYSMGSHLHFEIYVNGSRQDPLMYVSP